MERMSFGGEFNGSGTGMKTGRRWNRPLIVEEVKESILKNKRKILYEIYKVDYVRIRENYLNG